MNKHCYIETNYGEIYKLRNYTMKDTFLSWNKTSCVASAWFGTDIIIKTEFTFWEIRRSWEEEW